MYARPARYFTGTACWFELIASSEMFSSLRGVAGCWIPVFAKKDIVLFCCALLRQRVGRKEPECGDQVRAVAGVLDGAFKYSQARQRVHEMQVVVVHDRHVEQASVAHH